MASPALPSNRSFGTVFTVFFLILATNAYLRAAAMSGWAWGWLAAAGLTALVTLARPSLLAPCNRAWMRLGLALNKVVSPVVLGIMYGLLVVPVGLARRLAGKESMPRRFDPDLPSYWQIRKEKEVEPESFRRQF